MTQHSSVHPVNAPAAFIRGENVIYTGTARTHHVASFTGSVSIFSALFARHFGRSPLAYRRSL